MKTENDFNRQNMKEAFKKVFTKNDFGVDIVMCCASCKHHVSSGQKDRICMCKIDKDEEGNCKEHHVTFLCSHWKINDKKPIGAKESLATLKLLPTGHVKRKKYFDWIKENNYSFTEGRKPFEREHGSIYMDGRD